MFGSKRNNTAIFFILLSVILFGPSIWAQEGDKGNPQVGIFYGRILPNGLDRDDEIFPMWGGRFSLPMSEGGYWDNGLLLGSGSGVDWKGIFTTLSMHIPVETLVGHAGLGLDFTNYEADGDKAKNAVGMHFVGGVMAALGRATALRFDMKLTTKPGTTLFFGLGIVIELGGGDAAAGGG